MTTDNTTLDKEDLLTLDEWKEVLDYDFWTGFFTWKVKTSSKALEGQRAGTIDGDGYIVIRYKNFGFRAHRLAWFFMMSKWPKCQIDHINGNKVDNSFFNLREANLSQNAHNRKTKGSKSGARGVCFIPRTGRWKAYVKKDGKSVFQKNFDSFEEAVEAARLARILHHGRFANHQSAQRITE